MVLGGLGQQAADILISIRADNSQYNKALDKTQTRTQRFASTLKSYSGVAAGALAGIGVAAAGYAAKAAMAHQQVEGSFKEMVEQNGRNADEYLATLKRVTRGTVSEAKLMKQANEAMLANLDLDMIEEMYRSATVIAQATGESVQYMFQSLTEGIARNSVEMLDNLGIVMRSKEAYKKYAKEIGVSVNELSESEKRTAFQREAMERLRKKVEQVGGNYDTTSRSMAQMRAKLEDTAAEIGKEFLPIANQLLSWFNELLDSGIIQYVTRSMISFGNAIYGAGSAIEGALNKFLAFVAELTGNKDAAKKFSENAVEAFGKFDDAMQRSKDYADKAMEAFEEQGDAAAEAGQKGKDAADLHASGQNGLNSSVDDTNNSISEQLDWLSDLEQKWIEAGNYIGGGGEFIGRDEVDATPDHVFNSPEEEERARERGEIQPGDVIERNYDRSGSGSSNSGSGGSSGGGSSGGGSSGGGSDGVNIPGVPDTDPGFEPPEADPGTDGGGYTSPIDDPDSSFSERERNNRSSRGGGSSGGGSGRSIRHGFGDDDDDDGGSSGADDGKGVDPGNSRPTVNHTTVNVNTGDVHKEADEESIGNTIADKINRANATHGSGIW